MTTLNAGTKIFIGGISNDIFESDLIRYFEKYSKIDDCVIMVDKKTNHSRGFGFITVEDFYKAEAILKSQPHIIKGKRLECKVAIPKDMINEPEENFKKKPIKDISFYSRKLFVGGLPMLMKESDMLKYFQRFGEVEKCIIKKDEVTGKPRGFGFVIFVNKESIDVVLSYGNNHFVLGKWIEIKIATPKAKNTTTWQNNELNMQTVVNNITNESVNLNDSFISNQTLTYLNQTMNTNSNVNVNDNDNDTENKNENENETNNHNDSAGNIFSSDNFNAFATLPSNWSSPSKNQTLPNLFQYENYISQKQIAFFNKLHTNPPVKSFSKKKSNHNNNHSLFYSNTSSNLNGQAQKQKIETKPLQSLFANAQIQKEDKTSLKPLFQLNPNNNNSLVSTNLFGVNTENSSIDDSKSNNANNNSSCNNNNYHPNYKQYHNNNNNNLHPNNNNTKKDNNKFSHYFNNCITHPYFNSYYHYKLFDSHGEDLSKLIYKNSDKVNLFVDNQKRIQENIINENENTTEEQTIDLIIQEQNIRIDTITETETNDQVINLTEVIALNERDINPNDENHKGNGENRKEGGVYTDKDGNRDNTCYKTY